jgi:hypothetical protein
MSRFSSSATAPIRSTTATLFEISTLLKAMELHELRRLPIAMSSRAGGLTPNNKPIYDLMAFAKTFFAKHSLLNILTKVLRIYLLIRCC